MVKNLTECKTCSHFKVCSLSEAYDRYIKGMELKNAHLLSVVEDQNRKELMDNSFSAPIRCELWTGSPGNMR